MKKRFKNFTFIWSWFLTEKRLLLQVGIWACIVSLTGIAVPVFFKKIIDTVNDTGLTKTVKLDMLVMIVLQIWLLFLFNQFWWRLTSISQAIFDVRMKRKVSKFVFEYLNRHSYKFFSDNMSGSLIKKFHRFIWAISSLGYAISFDILMFSISIIWSLAIISFYSKFLWLAYILYFVIFASVGFLLTNRMMKHRIAYNESDSRMWWYTADVITNHFNLLTFATHDREYETFSKNVEENIWYQKKFYYSIEILFWSLGMIFMLIELLIYYIIIRMWWYDMITIWVFVMLISYQAEFWSKVFNLPNIIRRFSESLSDIEEMMKIIEIEHEIKDVKDAKELNVIKWEIEFNKVSFSYFEWQDEVLKNFSLKIKPWEKVALVWISWSWKTTVMKLLLRFYDLTSWKILIDGQDISKVSQDTLRRNIWLVPQEPVLFHRTLKENIWYAKDEVTDEEIIAASKSAQCHNFISKQEKGYDTLVWERWIKLSWWERQRVAIARVLLKNAKILLLDEATSALDSESEAYIKEAIDEAMDGKTTIAIAHRLSTIMKMDRIVVLDKWKIAEMWTHDELISKWWEYKKLWDIQSWGFIGE